MKVSEIYDKIVGMDLPDAESLAEESGHKIRVMMRDKSCLVGTCDYLPQRINVAVEEGKISSIIGTG